LDWIQDFLPAMTSSVLGSIALRNAFQHSPMPSIIVAAALRQGGDRVSRIRRVAKG